MKIILGLMTLRCFKVPSHLLTFTIQYYTMMDFKVVINVRSNEKSYFEKEAGHLKETFLPLEVSLSSWREPFQLSEPTEPRIKVSC